MTKKPTPAAKRFTPASAIPYVKRFQQAMLDDGGELPKHGADGLFGPETERAVVRLLVDVTESRSANERLQAERQSLRKALGRANEENGNLRADNISLQIELRKAKARLNADAWGTISLAVSAAALGAAGMWVAITVGVM